jgi:O-antigen ligase
MTTMLDSSMNSYRVEPSPRTNSKITIIPFMACVYATIISPLFLYFSEPPAGHGTPNMLEAGIPNRIFWPMLSVIAIVAFLKNVHRLGRLALPVHMICFLAYATFAGASIAWAFKPDIALTRFAQQVMILTCIILPALQAGIRGDLMRPVFICFAIGTVLNSIFVFDNSHALVAHLNGYTGYFLGKNYLGEFSTLAFLLALYELRFSGSRRAVAVVVIFLALSLLFLSNSKTALGLAIIIPLASVLTLSVTKVSRLSPAIILVSLLLCFMVLSKVTGINTSRLSYIIYGDPTFTGRTTIWEYVKTEISHRPLLGWGYQSFWLVGLDGPSVLNGWGWIKKMPNAHNGYYDTMLELGYVGFTLLIAFIVSTLHAVGRVARRDPVKAWMLLSLILYVILYNLLESLWMRAFEMVWVVFAIVAAELCRYLITSEPAIRPPVGFSVPRDHPFR